MKIGYGVVFNPGCKVWLRNPNTRITRFESNFVCLYLIIIFVLDDVTPCSPLLPFLPFGVISAKLFSQI